MKTTYPRSAGIGWGIFQHSRRSVSATAAFLTRTARCASLFLLVLCALASTPLAAQSLTANNWRMIYMNAPYSGGGANESQTVYSIHANRQENVLYSFDVSSRYGTTATGPATMTFTTAADPGAGGTNHNNYTLELVALNGHNANVNLDNATTFSRNV